MTVLLQYTFTGSAETPTTEAAGVTGGAITNGGLSTFGDWSPGFASDPVLTGQPPASTTTKQLAVDNNSYWYFTVTPDAGKKLDLTSLTMNVARGGASTPRGYALRSSIDSYAADIATADVATAITTWTALDIDLSGAAYQGLTAAVTFRFYIYAPLISNSIEADDITLNGTVGFTGLTSTCSIAGINHAYRATMADESRAAIVHPADWLASHSIGAGTDLNGLAPVGSIVPYAGPIAGIPAGWTMCNGDGFDRVGTYAALYAAIGTIWGAPDVDHFSVPDLRDKFIIGAKQDSGGLPMASVTGGLTQSLSPVSAALTHSMTLTDHGIAAHAGLSLAAHTITHTAVAVAAHPAINLSMTIGDHPTKAMITSTSSGSRTSAPTTPAHTYSIPTMATRGHTLTAIPDHTVAHTITQATGHAGDLTHSFTPPASQTFPVPAPAFVALAYIIRYS